MYNIQTCTRLYDYGFSPAWRNWATPPGFLATIKRGSWVMSFPMVSCNFSCNLSEFWEMETCFALK